MLPISFLSVKYDTLKLVKMSGREGGRGGGKKRMDAAVLCWQEKNWFLCFFSLW